MVQGAGDAPECLRREESRLDNRLEHTRRQWVDTPPGVAELVAVITSSSGPWGLDLEMTPTGVHDCELALCQLSDGATAWLVDPLRVDLRPVIAPLFARSFPVVVHDGGMDLTVIKRLYDLVPARVLDTFLAGREVGEECPSLQRLAHVYLDGLHLPKGQRGSNWCRRPLSSAQCRYAALDALILPDLGERLVARVRELGAEAALARAHAALLQRLASYVRPVLHPFQRSFDARVRDAAARGRLRRLLHWRTAMANEGHFDLFMGMGNRRLAELAQGAPQSCESLAADYGLAPRLVARYGRRILELVQGLPSGSHPLA